MFCYLEEPKVALHLRPRVFFSSGIIRSSQRPLITSPHWMFDTNYARATRCCQTPQLCKRAVPAECKYITFKKGLLRSGSGFFCHDPRSTRRSQFSQGRCRKTSRFNKDFLEEFKKKKKKSLNNKQCLNAFGLWPRTCRKPWQSSTHGPRVICLKVWQTSGSDLAWWIRASLWRISVRATRNRIFEPS